MQSLVKIMVLLLSAVVLFSCATKSFEKVEENIEEIKAEESAAPSDFGAMLLPLLSEEAEEKEEEELSLLFSDGDFIDIKNGEVYLEEKVTEVKEETPELEVEEMEVTEGEEKKEINILSFALILGFVLISLILIVVLVRGSGSRHKDEKKEEDESKDTEGISYLMELLKDEE